jgi:hypothetical protein
MKMTQVYPDNQHLNGVWLVCWFSPLARMVSVISFQR